MKKMIFAAFAAALLMLTSCGSNTTKETTETPATTSPKVFSKTLVDSLEAAKAVMDECDSTIGVNFEAAEWDNIITAADEALVKVDALIEQVNELNATGGDEYKNAILTCMNTVKEIIEISKKSAGFEGLSESEFEALIEADQIKREQLINEIMKSADIAKDYLTNVNPA